MTHQTRIKVRFYELDPYNHVNHAVYVSYFEVARIELLASIGFSMETMSSLGAHIVVTSITTRFLKSAGPGDELIVETDVVRMRRVSGQWRQRILRGDEVLATQLLEAAMTDVQGRPMRFLPELVTALQPHVVDGA